ncbi:hypothetical protein OP10G_1424 [Fimbriimonas ginsengisoli Gsoil 348]|uniref:Uncharacterized protein n=1 Tax=Fimbriimonas ginsengisoli Gsoil 348 TaxID=661478 RepID=A0A068NN13_FIMGI|nr:hypothetical protein OP10G_1424 [Fimbriimonas ginsengisoli Gsoil 348]
MLILSQRRRGDISKLRAKRSGALVESRPNLRALKAATST